jgi:hypothetical protein
VVRRERLLVITAEALRRDRLDTLRRVCQFLGVDIDWRPPELQRSTSARVSFAPQLLAPRPAVALRLAVRLGLSPRAARRLSYRPSRAMVPDQIDFSDAVRQRLEAELREDVLRLHGHLGPEFDGWGIA